jgi:hypothetical protein
MNTYRLARLRWLTGSLLLAAVLLLAVRVVLHGETPEGRGTPTSAARLAPPVTCGLPAGAVGPLWSPPADGAVQTPSPDCGALAPERFAAARITAC